MIVLGKSEPAFMIFNGCHTVYSLCRETENFVDYVTFDKINLVIDLRIRRC